jgi:hypothetical protein
MQPDNSRSGPTSNVACSGPDSIEFSVGSKDGPTRLLDKLVVKPAGGLG